MYYHLKSSFTFPLVLTTPWETQRTQICINICIPSQPQTSRKQVIVCGQGRESCLPPSCPLSNSPYLWRKQVHTGCGPFSKEAQRQKTLGWVVELPAQAFSGRMAKLGRRGKVGTSKCLWEPSFLLPVLWFPIHASLLQGLPLPPRVTNQIWIQVLRAKGSYFRPSYLPVSDLFHFLCFFFLSL